ncbi:hypothetical protein D3C85_951340 [compost metagenome]
MFLDPGSDFHLGRKIVAPDWYTSACRYDPVLGAPDDTRSGLHRGLTGSRNQPQIHRATIEYAIADPHFIVAVFGEVIALGSRRHGSIEQAHVGGLCTAQAKAQATFTQVAHRCGVETYRPVHQTKIEYRLAYIEPTVVGQRPSLWCKAEQRQGDEDR